MKNKSEWRREIEARRDDGSNDWMHPWILRGLLIALVFFWCGVCAVVTRAQTDSTSAQIEMRTINIDGYLLPYAPKQPYSDCSTLFIQGEDVTEQFIAHRENFADYIGLAYVMRIDGYAVWVVRSVTDDTLLYYAGWWWDGVRHADDYEFIAGHPSCGVYRVTNDYHQYLRSQ